MELKHTRVSLFNVSSESDFLYQDSFIRVLCVIDHMPLIVIDKSVKKIGHEKFNLIVVISQMLCLQRLYKGEPNNENEDNNTKNGKEFISSDETESSVDKKGVIKIL